jgi:integrase/recombinase XerD
MLTIYRRHQKSCPHKQEGRLYRRCKCVIWVDGTLDGKEIRESLKITSWERAQEIVRDRETSGTTGDQPQRVTIEKACTEFLADAEARELSRPSIYKYQLLFRGLRAFTDARGLRFMSELDLSALRSFRASWDESNITQLKKLERLRAFLRFVHDTGWISSNPASRIKNPIVTDPPTMPFTKEEMVRILAACEQYPDNYGNVGKDNAKRLRSLVLLLRYSGMRIGDACTCAIDRLQGNKIFLYTHKTKVPVNCVLPEFVASSLREITTVSERYFFWTGEGTTETASSNWRRSLRKLFKLADVKDGHPHRFRDTFAVELLLSGVLIERVAILLGHKSIRVTERHYSPWVRARQEQLEADLTRSWAQDPIVLAETKGTPQVHGSVKVVN